MTDIFYEHIVVRKNGIKEYMLIALAIFLAIILAFLSLFIPFMALALIAYIFACYFFKFPNTYLEFEYALLNNEMSIDIIINKSKRKKAKVFDVKNIVLLSNANSADLKAYAGIKQYNYSSNNPENRIYTLVVKNNISTEAYIMDLDERLLEMISLYARNSIKL